MGAKEREREENIGRSADRGGRCRRGSLPKLPTLAKPFSSTWRAFAQFHARPRKLRPTANSVVTPTPTPSPYYRSSTKSKNSVRPFYAALIPACLSLRL